MEEEIIPLLIELMLFTFVLVMTDRNAYFLVYIEIRTDTGHINLNYCFLFVDKLEEIKT